MTEANKQFSPLLLLGDGLLLLCAIVGLSTSFFSLYSGAPDPLAHCAAGLSGFSGWAALFALLSLGAWSLPRFRTPTAGGLAAVWVGTALWNWDACWQGAQLTYSAISTQFAQRVAWGSAYTFKTELTTLQQRSAVEVFLLLALALLAWGVGWAVIRGRSWLLTVLLTLPPLLPGLLADLFPDWPAFMTLCACWCTLLLAELCQDAPPAGRARLNLVLLSTAALTLALLTLALPRPGYARPAWALQAEQTLTNWGSRLSEFFERFEGPFHTTITYVGSAETVNLGHAGPLNYTGRTVLRVKSDYTGHLYLRGTSLAVYDGGSWSTLPDEAYQAYLDSFANQTAPSPLLFPTLLGGTEQTYTATVNNVGAVGSCVYVPYQLVDQNWGEAGMMPVEDAFIARLRGQWTHTIAFSPLPPAATSDMASGETVVAAGGASADELHRSFAQDSARALEPDYRNYVEEHYLDVPEALHAYLLELLQDQGLRPYDPNWYMYSSLYLPDKKEFNPDVYKLAYAEVVASLLDTLCEYDPNTPLTPEGEDFVEYFLSESHRGYCMHFASAAALMFRTLGIPARYVSGFTADTVAGKEVDVPDRAAHAWVEIYVDGFGWYPVEVTPDYDWNSAPGQENSPGLPSQQPSQQPEESDLPVPSGALLPSQAPQDRPGGPGPGEGGGWAWLLWPALVLGLAALLWLGQCLPKLLRVRRLAGPDANRAVLYGYRCLLRLRRWGGEVDDTALELAQKARFSQHTLSGEEQQAMARMVNEQRLRLCRRLHPAARLAFRYWWGKPKR